MKWNEININRFLVTDGDQVTWSLNHCLAKLKSDKQTFDVELTFNARITNEHTNDQSLMTMYCTLASYSTARCSNSFAHDRVIIYIACSYNFMLVISTVIRF